MRVTRFFRRNFWDAERAKELEAYLAEEIDDNLARGLTLEAATRAAHLKLGNATRIREDIYEMNTLPVVDALWRDLRYAMRLLRKNPVFSIVAILTLALGTGANAAIFQLVNAVRMRPLPIEKAEELVSVGINTHGHGRMGRGFRGRSIHTAPIWRELQTEQQAFVSMAAWGTDSWDLSTEGERVPAAGLYVSGSFFESLGVVPHIGRVLTSADDQLGCGSPVAVLSYAFWRTRFAGSSGVLGQTISLERRPFTVVGVTPQEFFGVEVGRTFDAAIPLCAEPMMRGEDSALLRRDAWWLDVIGRLKPDWTLQRAESHLSAISPGVFQATLPSAYNADGARQYTAFTLTATSAFTGVSNVRTTYETELWLLLGATGLVLLLACANLANLMLARASTRDREIAVRLAIGGSRIRILRQLLTESLLIAVFGAAAGLLLAGWLSDALVGFLSTESNRLFVDLSLDWRVLLFMTALAMATSLMFGLSPAIRATRTDPAKAMQAGGRTTSDTYAALSLRRGLLVVQVAISIVLVVGAVLFGRTLRNLHSVELGFRADLIAADVDWRRSGIQPQARQHSLAAVMERVRAMPGVRHASETMIVPLSGPAWNGRIRIDGALQEGETFFNAIGSDYFQTLEQPLRTGREFDSRDRLGAPRTAVVNETLARRYFPDSTALGRTFQLEVGPGEEAPVYEIIGVVGDAKYRAVREEFLPVAYFAMTQEPQPIPFFSIVVQSDVSSAATMPALTRAITSAAPGASVSYDTITQYIGELLVTERLMASLSAFLGVLALVIAMIGLYGVMSYVVTRRQAEIGIRVALGAEPRAVIRMMLTESTVLLGIGLAVGLPLALFASRYAETLLYGLTPADPGSFAFGVAALAAVSLLAAWLPARRAAIAPPTLALRE